MDRQADEGTGVDITSRLPERIRGFDLARLRNLVVPLERWEAITYGSLLLMAAVLRFWDLGARAYHHDESLHVYYSYLFSNGGAFEHNPLMHGPLQFEMTALAFNIFGDGDFVGRIVPALLGVVLVGMPLLLRDYLGRTGAIVTAVLLMVSPSILYYSRFARNDVYILVFDLLLFYAIFRYMQHRQPRYLYIAAATIALGVAAKEVFFMTLFISAAFLFVLSAPDLWGYAKGRIPRSKVAAPATMLVLLVTLTLPQSAAMLGLVQGPLGLTLVNDDWTIGIIGAPLNKESGYVNDGVAWLEDTFGISLPAVNKLTAASGEEHGAFEFGRITVQAVDVAVGFTLLLVAISVGLGLWWGGKRWAIAAGIFWVIYLVLFTTFFSNLQGIASGLWQSVGYWVAQQDVRRGDQPWYYYLIMLPTYEFLPLIFGIGLAIWYVLRGYVLGAEQRLFAFFLVFWGALTFILYSYAGEKMPWLTVHLALPLILAAGLALGRLIDGVIAGWRESVTETVESNGSNTSAGLEAPAGGARERGLLAPAMALARARPFAVSALTVAGLLFLLTIRAAFTVSYESVDIPNEMLIYTQTAPAIPELRDRIDALGAATGEGLAVPVLVDTADAFGWPWYWYLRKHTNVRYVDLSNTSVKAEGRVLLLRVGHEDKVTGLDEGYGPSEPYPFRQWFPEGGTYKGPGGPLSFGDFADGLTNPSTWGVVWNYWMFKEPPARIGSIDAVAYFPLPQAATEEDGTGN